MKSSIANRDGSVGGIFPINFTQEVLTMPIDRVFVSVHARDNAVVKPDKNEIVLAAEFPSRSAVLPSLILSKKLPVLRRPQYGHDVFFCLTRSNFQ